MSLPVSRAVSILALSLVAGRPGLAAAPTPAARIAVSKIQEASRATAARSHLRAMQAELGLDDAVDFRVHHAFTNEQGTTIVRLEQTHLGYPVLSGSAIVHVGPGGTIQKVIPSVAAGIQLTGAPALTADQAKAIALKNLAAKGPLDGSPTVTQVVFPSRKTGGYVTKLDPATGKVVLDRELSVWAKRPTVDYVWAYEVSTSQWNAQDGMKQICFIVDGDTGAILRKWNNLRSDTAAKGTGNSLYNGTVVLTATQSTANGTFSLIDPTRGSTPSVNAGTGFNTGMTTFYDSLAPQWWGGLGETLVPYTGNATNAWGDGQVFGGVTVYNDPASGAYYWANAPSPNGQTAAVDAQFGMATTWDMFLNVFGRNGMDGKGQTMDALVHNFAPTMDGSFAKYDRHFFVGGSGSFSPGSLMVLGDGTYPQDPNGARGPQTEIDIVAHEMTHALTWYTVNFDPNATEPPVLEEATCDMFGQAAKAYALRAPGADTTIPEFPAGDLKYWTFGYQADRGKPERYLYKPSLDGMSADGWYDGIGYLWPWFASGPLNRMFYFLSEGASSAASDPTYSPYMPGGMSGIGLEKATRIWYKALTEDMTSEATMHDALTASDAAATALYGAGSPEELAVLNAFYAVNIGDGAPGQPKHVLVTFPIEHAPGTLLANGGTSFQPGQDAKIQFFPPNTTVSVQVDVQNTANTAVTWSAGRGNQTDAIQGGTFNADGTWTTPMSPSADWEPFLLVATSQADPSQFAKGPTLIVAIDADMDTESDALDLGQVAMSWGLPSSVNPYPSTNIWSSGPTSDWDVALFNEVLTHTWPAK